MPRSKRALSGDQISARRAGTYLKASYSRPDCPILLRERGGVRSTEHPRNWDEIRASLCVQHPDLVLFTEDECDMLSRLADAAPNESSFIATVINRTVEV